MGLPEPGNRLTLTIYSQAFKEEVVRKMRAQEWTPEQRLQALLDTNNLSTDELNAWCRERGIFAHQLQAWKAELCMPAKPPTDAAEVRKLKAELTSLQRELNRKEKALSEAAALLVLQKKVPSAVGGRARHLFARAY